MDAAGRLPRVLGAVCGWSVLCVHVLALWAARPWLGGADGFYFFLTARDFTDPGPSGPPLNVYGYFPGFLSYLWLWLRTDNTWAAAQTAYAALLVAQVVGVVVVARAVGVRTAVAVAVAGVYVSVFAGMSALDMTSEPLAGAVACVGLAGALALSRRAKWMHAACVLGASAGACVYAKQQGAVCIVLALAPVALNPPHVLRLAGVWFVSAVTTLGLLFAANGGITAFREGLGTTQQYALEGAWWHNVVGVESTLFPFDVISLGAVAWFWRVPAAAPWVRMRFALALATIVLLVASTVPLAARAYPHYLLYAVPFVLAVVGAFVDDVITRWPTLSVRARQGLLAGGALVLACVAVRDVPWLHPTRMLAAPRFSDEFATLAPLCAHVKPGEQTLIVPTRYAAFHVACGTRVGRVADGYGFTVGADPVGDTLRTLREHPPVNVVFFDGRRTDTVSLAYDEWLAHAFDWNRVVDAADAAGYRLVASTSSYALYRKPSAGK